MSEDNTPVLLENSIPNENTENSIPEKYRHRTLINKKYIFEKKIGSGSFGSVHRGKNVISGESVAIKYEATTANITTLLWESKILNHLSGTPGVVKLRYYGTESNKNIIVMDLFSHTLCEEVAKLKELYSNESVAIKNSDTNAVLTTQNSRQSENDLSPLHSRSPSLTSPPLPHNLLNDSDYNKNSNDTAHALSSVDAVNDCSTFDTAQTPRSLSSSSQQSAAVDTGDKNEIKPYIKDITNYLISMLEIIWRIHDAGIVHRDIKPENFMFKKIGEEKKLHIIDFGLSRFYMKGNNHVENTKNRSIVGTIRYISLNVHEGDVYSRRDDIVSIMYVIIYLIKGNLPWMGLVAKKGDTRTKDQLVYSVKSKVTTAELCEGIPYLFKKLLDYSYTLDFDEKPDYSYMIRQCKNLIKIL
jgi:serine/threonine protein kinase